MKFCKPLLLVLILLTASCSSSQKKEDIKEIPIISVPEPIIEYGFVADSFYLVKNEIILKFIDLDNVFDKKFLINLSPKGLL